MNFSPKSTLFSLVLFCRNAVKISEIRIKNLLLRIKEAKLIQKIINPYLTTVSFEECSFIFDEECDFHFNFSQLKNLTHFQWSNCYCKNTMSMLKTIPSGCLHHLNLSESHLKASKEEFMQFLMQQVNLQTLNVAKNQKYKLEFPVVTGDVLNLKKVESLNLSGNVDWSSLVKKLEEIEGPLNLKRLELFNLSFVRYFDFFCKYFTRLTNLKYLGIGDSININHLTNNIYRLTELEEIEFSSLLNGDATNRLLEKFKDLNRTTTISLRQGRFEIKTPALFVILETST